ncbi:(2Fe-2S)-binding protein [Streptomyces albus]|uniref:(2Fe-2S)-binding protein n=1 Tax=Streptomyces albus TaxID=1888 RepID=UPI0033E10FB6
MRMNLTVNGERHTLEEVRESESLLFVLRERVGLPGTKNACEQGRCGSCSVLLDGMLCCSCLVPAVQARERSVTTVEGLAGQGGPGEEDGPDSVQRAFLDAGAVQCGFCTPGMLLAAHNLLRHTPDPQEAEVRQALAGNICRCTGYQHIVDAVLLAAEYRRAERGALVQPDGAP